MLGGSGIGLDDVRYQESSSGSGQDFFELLHDVAFNALVFRVVERLDRQFVFVEIALQCREARTAIESVDTTLPADDKGARVLLHECACTTIARYVAGIERTRSSADPRGVLDNKVQAIESRTKPPHLILICYVALELGQRKPGLLKVGVVFRRVGNRDGGTGADHEDQVARLNHAVRRERYPPLHLHDRALDREI